MSDKAKIEQLKKTVRNLRLELKRCREGLRWHERNAAYDAMRDRSWERK